MRYPFFMAICYWIGIVAAQAQTSPTPGMGPTSPLGAPSTANSPLDSSSSGLGGIPLGSTEINTSGVSPLIMPCPGTSSNAAFDGGGSAQSNNCGSSSSNTAATSMSGGGMV